jgi:hypothetical protein
VASGDYSVLVMIQANRIRQFVRDHYIAPARAAGHAEITRRPMPPPATGTSTLSFSFRPHTSMEEVLKHNQGQVEVDGMFVSLRKGRPSEEARPKSGPTTSQYGRADV